MRSTRQASNDFALRQPLAFQRFAAVQLHHAHAARRRRLHAQVAQNALIEILLDDRRLAVAVRAEDVDRADLRQLLGQVRIPATFAAISTLMNIAIS